MLSQSPSYLNFFFEDERAVIHEERAMIEPGVVFPTYKTGELLQFEGDAGRYRGIVERVSHRTSIGSGQIGFTMIVWLTESRRES